MTWLFAPPPPPSLAILGTDQRFPVARIWCVGRNYAAHAREMGADPDREPPFFFAKPATALVTDGRVPYPPATHDLQHEVELVVTIHGSGRDVAVEDALTLVFGYAVGIDLTRRDLQHDAKKHGRPWDMAKGFDFSAPCSPLQPATTHPTQGRIELSVQGKLRQHADLRDMLWSVAETVSALSRLVTLRPGDLIFTGTPEGVGPVLPGDVLTCAVAGVATLTVTIDPPLMSPSA
jgi:fumarylpyruvate hydrolase